MRSRPLALLAAALLPRARARAFNAHDDLLAFPQYEIAFADAFILQSDASSILKRQRITEDPAAPSPTLLRPPDHASKPSAPEAYEPMILDSTSYLCALPSATPDAAGTGTAPATGPKELSAAEEAKEVARATVRGGELLGAMEGRCIYYVSGWWSYSFCYNEEVKQFHALPPGRQGVPLWPPIEDTDVPSFILGEFGAEITEDQSAQSSTTPGPSSSASGQPERGLALPRVASAGETRILSQRLGGGTPCDITGRPRRVEVQYKCEPGAASDHIGHVKETSTCAYRLVVHTPRLCSDVVFQPPRAREARRVICREVLADAAAMEGWRARRAADAERRLIGAGPEGAPPAGGGHGRQVVGGIEVGGMKQVGRDGGMIAPPDPYDPVPYTAELVASYHPAENEGRIWKMPRDELRKQDISATAVNQLIDELQGLSGGQPWKVEAVDTPKGRELRGVLEEDEEDLDWEQLRDEL